MNVTITGMGKVMSNLNKEIRGIKSRTMTGLIMAVIMLRRDMEDTSPLIPVDHGNLRASWFMLPIYLHGKAGVYFGFTANYAWYVHEMMDAIFKRPGAGAKFLEAALNRNHKRILNIIRSYGAVK